MVGIVGEGDNSDDAFVAGFVNVGVFIKFKSTEPELGVAVIGLLVRATVLPASATEVVEFVPKNLVTVLSSAS